jgi:hypothetical protein
MKDKLILKNQTVLEIEAGSSINNIMVLSSTKEEMLEKLNKLTKENISYVEIKNSEDVLIATYENLIFVNETSEVLEDETIKTSFNFRIKTQMEIDIDELKEDMNALNEAIGGM